MIIHGGWLLTSLHLTILALLVFFFFLFCNCNTVWLFRVEKNIVMQFYCFKRSIVVIFELIFQYVSLAKTFQLQYSKREPRFYLNALFLCWQVSAPPRLYFSCLTVTQMVSYSKYCYYYYIIIFFESRWNACVIFVVWGSLGLAQAAWERHWYCCCPVVSVYNTLLFLHAHIFGCLNGHCCNLEK